MKNLKTKLKVLLDIIVGYGPIVGLVYLIFIYQPTETVHQPPEVRTVETRIEGKDTLIKEIQTRIIHDNAQIEILSNQLADLKNDLINVKQARDTVMIVQIQDTIINTLTDENSHLRNVVVGQDSIIVAQRYIIDSKDTIISIGNTNIKKLKRQRNLSVLVNVIQGAILIIKK